MKGCYMALTIGFQGLPDDVGGDIIAKSLGWIKPEEPNFLIFDPEQEKTVYEDGGRTLMVRQNQRERILWSWDHELKQYVKTCEDDSDAPYCVACQAEDRDFIDNDLVGF